LKFLKSSSRRALLVAASILLPLHAGAQTQWPAKPIKLVVPFAPGGSNDNIARVLAAKLGTRLGQTVIVDNRGGSGGTIGTDAVVKAPPDGYTILFASTSITTNAASGKKLPYDLVKDLQPIGMVATSPFAVVVSNDLKAKTLREFIDLARAKPKSISYGSAGVGGINHLGTELLASEAKIQLVHVPYKGIGPRLHRPHGREPADAAAHRGVGRAAHPRRKDARPGGHGCAAIAARAGSADGVRSRRAGL
jgi:tripartite-type tricarboxylate transporter receptor subunit TctC